MATGGMHKTAVRGQADAYFDEKCTRCEGKDKHTEATCYCPTCHQHFCDGCQKLHEEYKKEHAVIDKANGNRKEKRSTELASLDECPDHHGHRITMFCGQHGSLCCTLSASTAHSSCENKSFISKLSVGVLQSRELCSLKSDINDVQTQTKHIKNVRGKMLYDLDKSKTRFKETLKDFKTKVAKILENLERSATLEMDSQYKQRSNAIQSDLDKCDEIIHYFNDLTDQLDNSAGNKTEPQLFIRMKTGQDKILDSREHLSNMSCPRNNKLTFALDTSILQNLENTKALGSFSQKPFISEEISLATNYTECYVRNEKDTKPCDIQGICQIMDGSLILSDHNNRNLKRLDDSYAIVDVCTMPGFPNRICCSGRKEVAVSLGKMKMIQLVSVTDKMRPTQSLRLEHKCYGIACHKRMLYVTDGWMNCYVYKLDRSHKQIECKKVRILQFSMPKSIAVSKDGCRIFIVDSSDEITIADSQGQILSIVHHPNLVTHSDKDACVDAKGNVLVCNKTGHNVVQFVDLGDKERGVLVEGYDMLSKPEVVCVDDFRRKLIVQTNDIHGVSDSVCVFDIRYDQHTSLVDGFLMQFLEGMASE